MLPDFVPRRVWFGRGWLDLLIGADDGFFCTGLIAAGPS